MGHHLIALKALKKSAFFDEISSCAWGDGLFCMAGLSREPVKYIVGCSELGCAYFSFFSSGKAGKFLR